MNIKVLKQYMNYCKQGGIEPTFQGLKRFNELTKDLHIPKHNKQ